MLVLTFITIALSTIVHFYTAHSDMLGLAWDLGVCVCVWVGVCVGVDVGVGV